jgi:hypothetical protein
MSIIINGHMLRKDQEEILRTAIVSFLFQFDSKPFAEAYGYKSAQYISELGLFLRLIDKEGI